MQRLNGRRVAYLDQPEDGGTFGVTGYGHYDDGDTIVVTAQRRAGQMLGLMGSMMEAFNLPNPFSMYTTLNSLDRIAMRLTNPAPRERSFVDRASTYAAANYLGWENGKRNAVAGIVGTLGSAAQVA